MKLFAGANAVIRLQKQVQEKHLLFSSPNLLSGSVKLSYYGLKTIE